MSPNPEITRTDWKRHNAFLRMLMFSYVSDCLKETGVSLVLYQEMRQYLIFQKFSRLPQDDFTLLDD